MAKAKAFHGWSGQRDPHGIAPPRRIGETDAQYTFRTGQDQLGPELRELIIRMRLTCPTGEQAYLTPPAAEPQNGPRFRHRAVVPPNRCSSTQDYPPKRTAPLFESDLDPFHLNPGHKRRTRSRCKNARRWSCLGSTVPFRHGDVGVTLLPRWRLGRATHAPPWSTSPAHTGPTSLVPPDPQSPILGVAQRLNPVVALKSLELDRRAPSCQRRLYDRRH
jgi:hypothetical protein